MLYFFTINFIYGLNTGYFLRGIGLMRSITVSSIKGFCREVSRLFGVSRFYVHATPEEIVVFPVEKIGWHTYRFNPFQEKMLEPYIVGRIARKHGIAGHRFDIVYDRGRIKLVDKTFMDENFYQNIVAEPIR